MVGAEQASEVLAAVLEADHHALFLVDPRLRVRSANGRAERLMATRRLFKYDETRLTGSTRRVEVQLAQAVQATLQASGALAPPYRVWGKPSYIVQLSRLGLADGPLVLLRVFEGYAAPDASGEVPLALTERGATAIHRRLSADGKHGPSWASPRSPLPPLAPLLAFEAYARRGSMAPAAEELGAWTKTISRAVRGLETATGRLLVQGSGHHVTLTPAGRQLARALTDAFDILEAAVRPRPPGERRGRKPKTQEDVDAEDSSIGSPKGGEPARSL